MAARFGGHFPHAGRGAQTCWLRQWSQIGGITSFGVMIHYRHPQLVGPIGDNGLHETALDQHRDAVGARQEISQYSATEAFASRHDPTGLHPRPEIADRLRLLQGIGPAAIVAGAEVARLFGSRSPMVAAERRVQPTVGIQPPPAMGGGGLIRLIRANTPIVPAPPVGSPSRRTRRSVAPGHPHRSR